MTFFVVTVGVLAGFAFVVSPTVRGFLRPAADLLVAARPLLVPLLVILAAATVNLPLVVQLVVAALLVILVHRIVVRPELERATSELPAWWNAIENGVANAARKTVAVAAPAVLGCWLLLRLVFGDDGLLGGHGGVPAAVLLVGLVAVLAAAGARLIAYASNWPRAVVSVLLGLALLSGLMALGVLPSPLGPAGPVALVLALAATVCLAATMIFEQVKAPQRTDAQIERMERWLGAGLALAVLSGLLLATATASSLLVLDNRGSAPLTAERGPHPSLYKESDGSLGYRYAPVLAFTLNQQWTPVDANDYLEGGKVLRADGKPAEEGKYECPSIGPRSCFRVTISCSSAEDACSKALGPHEKGDTVSDGKVYVRTLQRPDADDGSAEAVALRGIFRPVTDVASRTNTLLQYWFFYRYDEWTTRVLGARLTQRHEGDWEAVTVGLDVEARPLFVAYSAHCGGTWKRWADTEHFESHPLVAVAEGSQANYAEAGSPRPPDFTSCTRLPRGIGTLLSFAANIRDVTSDDWHWGAAEVTPVDESDMPMSFPGSWGGHDVTEFKNFRTSTTEPGPGPRSPPLQALWQDPIRVIFCNRYWDGPEEC